jgi:hypothetical protein
MNLRGFLWAACLPVIFCLCLISIAQAQLLPEQDCVGAIPLCQTVYTTTTAYNGTGALPNEINPTKSCLSSGEKNDAWYIFTAQTSGNVGFLITPFNGQDDYDWAVFNITNKPCSMIFNDAAMEVSCNYDANIGCGGMTGPNGTISGCGQTEQLIPVNAGETYVVNVSNYSSSQNGYTIDFGSSSALIYDNQPPQKVLLNTSCADKNFTLHFNETIDCRTISNYNNDLVIADENGLIKNIPSITGVGCSSTSFYTTAVNIVLDDALSNSGTYYLIAKTGAEGNTISDKCNNFFAVDDTVAFITPINNLTANLGSDIFFCPEDLNAPVLQLPFSNDAAYLWTLNGQTIPTIINQDTILEPGIYTGTISYGSLCAATDTVVAAYFPSLAVSTNNDTTLCTGQQLPGLSSNILSGIYNWALNGIAVSATNNFQPTQAGTYVLTVSKANFCSGTDTVIITTVAPPQLNLGNDVGVCTGDTVTLTANTQINFYEWSLNNQVISTAASLQNITATGSYILKAGINATCFDSDTVVVFSKALTPISLGDDRVSCIYDSLPQIVALSTASNINWFYNKGALTETGTTIRALGAGSYIAMAAAKDLCVNSDTMVLSLDQVLPVNFGEDKTVCQTNATVLQTNILSQGIFEWELDGNNLLQDGSSLNVNQTGNYIFNFIGNTGCNATDTIYVELRKPLAKPLVNCPITESGKKVFTWNEISAANGYHVSEDVGLNWITPTDVALLKHQTNIAVNQLWVRAVGDSVCTVGEKGISSACEVFVPSVFISSQENYFMITGAETPLRIEITDAMGRSVFFEGDYKNNFSLNKLSVGIYYYRIKSGKAKYQTGKFLFLN